MTIQINRLFAAIETQAATIARLERERDQAQVLAELAKPEAREWRVLAEDHSQCFASEAEANAAADWLRTNDAGNVYVDSRTVGPWERAE